MENALIYFKKYFYEKENIKLTDDKISSTDSSGSSIVFFIENFNVVFQYYDNPEIVEFINNLYNVLFKNDKINIVIDFSHGFGRHRVNETISMNVKLSDYIVNKIDVLGPNMIIWEKIIPLTSLPKEKMDEILKNNFHKLVYNIGKSLSAMHSLGYLHGDCSIDNIGIIRGNFVLFDFNMSKQIKKNNQPSSDFYIFMNSINFRYNDRDKTKNFFEVRFMQSFVQSLSREMKKTNLEIVNYLENLKLIL